MGINNPAIAQYVGFGLHVLTGTIAGNIFGQISLFVNRLTPTGYANGMLRGILLGIALWLVLFLPITVYVIQPKLNSIAFTNLLQERLEHCNTFSRAIFINTWRVFCLKYVVGSYIWNYCRQNGRIKFIYERA